MIVFKIIDKECNDVEDCKTIVTLVKYEMMFGRNRENDREIINIKLNTEYYSKAEIGHLYEKLCLDIDCIAESNTLGLINETHSEFSCAELIYAYLLYKTKNIYYARTILRKRYNVSVNNFDMLFMKFYMVPLEEYFCFNNFYQ